MPGTDESPALGIQLAQWIEAWCLTGDGEHYTLTEEQRDFLLRYAETRRTAGQLTAGDTN